MANNSISYNFDPIVSTDNSSINHLFTPNVGTPSDNKFETITTFDTIPFGSLGRFSKSIDTSSKIKRELYNNTCILNKTQNLNQDSMDQMLTNIPLTTKNRVTV